jgi:DNA primase
MAQDNVELIKERMNIADLVRTYVQLQPAGKNLRGLCPFHKEKTPSFIVSPDRATWHCFGCGLGGDIFSFLMRFENLEFREALKVLAERTGVQLVGSSADERAYDALYDINRAAKEIFVKNLWADIAAAQVARDYLVERGLKESTIREFEIGFAPNSSDGVSRALTKTGFRISDIERAGLVFKTERGTYWDRFRGRIMFPIANSVGKVVGFTGRIMPGVDESGTGKYINSPETPIFNKSKLLFGIHKTKQHIRETRSAVLVEGQMDFLMAWQDGIKHIVASSGTALTKDHLEGLKRSADTLIVLFDRDEAGEAATERVIDLGNALDFSMKVVDPARIKEVSAKDPADIARAQPGLLLDLISHAEPALRHYFRRYLGSFKSSDLDSAAMKRSIRTVLQKIKIVASPIEQSHWLQELSGVTRIGEVHLVEEMKALVPEKPKSGVAPEISGPAELPQSFTRRDLISQRILSLALNQESYREKVTAELAFMNEPYRVLAAHLLNIHEGESEPKKIPSDLAALADLVSLRSSFELVDKGKMEKEFSELTRHLRQEYFREARERVGAEIHDAERAGDETRLARALQEFARISREIHEA